jgi:hypothetical protein
MTIEFVPFQPEHLAQIKLPARQAEYYDRLIQPGYAESLATGPAWTALARGRVIGCAGFLEQWSGRAIAWAMAGDIPTDSGPSILEKLKSVISEQTGRIEFTAPTNNGAACGVAHALGFVEEGLMRSYGPDGSDHILFARVV